MAYDDTRRKNNSRVTDEEGQYPWMQLHDKVVTDDTDVLTVTTQDWGNKGLGDYPAVRVQAGMKGIEVTFAGIATDQTKVFKWKLYGYRWRGPAQLIANGEGNLGDVAVVTHPVSGAAVTAYYADFLSITASNWKKTVAVYDVGASSGEIATIVFDGMGIGWLRLELTDCYAGTADEVDEIEAFFSGGGS